MQDVAAELGGEGFAATIAEACANEAISQLPDPNALNLVEMHYPGAAAKVMTRMEAIANAT